MAKEKIGINKSTELFYDLACRSFPASWKMFIGINGDLVDELGLKYGSIILNRCYKNKCITNY